MHDDRHVEKLLLMSPNAIYFKTNAGVAEVGARSLGLRAELRRLLILVDGRASLSRLAVFVRGSEIEFLMAELEHQGLVSSAPVAAASGSSPSGPASVSPSANAGSAAAEPVGASYPEPTATQMRAVRQTAIRTLHDLLGPDADALAVIIEHCKDSRELRVAVTDIRQTLDRQMGVAAGQRFLESVRTAAENTR